MKKKHYIIYIIILISLYLIIPTIIIIANRTFNFTDAEMTALALPTTFLLLCGTIIGGMLLENLKD